MSNTEIFPFFSLPREIRDLIYSHCLMKYIPIFLPNALSFRIYDYPRPHLFRINHQFKSELGDTAKEYTSLRVYHAGTPGGCNGFTSQIPRALKTIQNITFSIDCWRVYDATGDLARQGEWIKEIFDGLDPGRLKSISYHINLNSKTTAHEYESAMLWTGLWTDSDRLRELHIIRPEQPGRWNPRTLLSKWDRERKQFVRVAEDWMEEEGENVSSNCGPSGLMWQGEVAYLFE